MTNRLARLTVPITVVLVILMMVVPLPHYVLSTLIAFNVSASLVVLIMALQVQRPLDFAVFPTIVLVMTIFRLSLNVSATRLVLRDGYAGSVIESFGHFVIGGSLVIGLVVFAILVVIQLAVITNGAARVAEVGARFTLDAMPGKQMAIDADLNSGLIDEDTARKRRSDVAAEADFYGAMDGGTKFVKGDAIAAVIITLVNLIGGFTIGILQRGMSASESINTYSLLTVGDGLVSQIPALLLSVATGVIVTRSTSEGDVGSDLIAQFAKHTEAMRIGGGALLGLMIIPGMPKLPFLIAGGAILGASFLTPRQPSLDDLGEGIALPGAPGAAELGAADENKGNDPISDSLKVDLLELVLAADVVDLVDPARGGDLLDRVRALRRKTALDLGIVLPPVRTRDGTTLDAGTYEIRIGGVCVGTGEAPPGCLLAIGDAPDSLPGRRTTEPVFGLPAVWVPTEYRSTAELTGVTLVERAAVLTTHLAEMVRVHASRLLGLDDVKELLEVLRAERPAAVEELTPNVLSLAGIQKILHGLLDEQVSIRDLGRILEGVGQRSRQTTDGDALLEAARASLGPALTAPFIKNGTLYALTVDPGMEQQLAEGLRASEDGVVLALDGGLVQHLVSSVGALLTASENRGEIPVLLVSGPLRLPLRRLLRASFPQLPVIGFAEANGNASIQTVGQVNRAHEFATA